MPIDGLIETAKGRHVRTADVLRAIAKEVRHLPGRDGAKNGERGPQEKAERLALKIERLAASIDGSRAELRGVA